MPARKGYAGEEGGAPGRAALLGIIGHKPRAFIREAIDVRGFTDHKPLVISADVHDADVIAHNEQDVGFVGGNCRIDRQGQCHSKRHNP